MTISDAWRSVNSIVCSIKFWKIIDILKVIYAKTFGIHFQWSFVNFFLPRKTLRWKLWLLQENLAWACMSVPAGTYQNSWRSNLAVCFLALVLLKMSTRSRPRKNMAQFEKKKTYGSILGIFSCAKENVHRKKIRS